MPNLKPLTVQNSRASPSPTVDALVVGAGPVGLAAALQLDAIGYHAVIVAPPGRPPDQRTAALLAGSVAFLEGLGAWAAIAAEAAPLKSLRIVDATLRLIRAPEVLFHASEIGLDAFGYNVANAAITAALDARCSELGIERIDARVERIEASHEAIVARLDNGGAIVTRLAIAADGRQSRVRHSIGITTVDWRYDQAALVANLSHTVPHEDTSTEFHTEHGPFTLVPLLGCRSSLVWVDRPAEAKRRAGLAQVALGAEIEAQSASILGAISVEGLAQVFPLAGMGVTAFAARRSVLVGEAAHLFPPIGAQGLNLGYRDVATLGEVLADRPADPGDPDRLTAYDRARRSDIYTRTAAVDALNRTLLTGFLPVQALRGLGLFLLDRVPAIRQAVMRGGIARAT